MSANQRLQMSANQQTRVYPRARLKISSEMEFFQSLGPYPKGPAIEKNNPDRKFQSRLKFSISLENFRGFEKGLAGGG